MGKLCFSANNHLSTHLYSKVNWNQSSGPSQMRYYLVGRLTAQVQLEHALQQDDVDAYCNPIGSGLIGVIRSTYIVLVFYERKLEAYPRGSGSIHWHK